MILKIILGPHSQQPASVVVRLVCPTLGSWWGVIGSTQRLRMMPTHQPRRWAPTGSFSPAPSPLSGKEFGLVGRGKSEAPGSSKVGRRDREVGRGPRESCWEGQRPEGMPRASVGGWGLPSAVLAGPALRHGSRAAPAFHPCQARRRHL